VLSFLSPTCGIGLKLIKKVYCKPGLNLNQPVLILTTIASLRPGVVHDGYTQVKKTKKPFVQSNEREEVDSTRDEARLELCLRQ